MSLTSSDSEIRCVVARSPPIRVAVQARVARFHVNQGALPDVFMTSNWDDSKSKIPEASPAGRAKVYAAPEFGSFIRHEKVPKPSVCGIDCAYMQAPLQRMGVAGMPAEAANDSSNQAHLNEKSASGSEVTSVPGGGQIPVIPRKRDCAGLG